MPQTAATTGFPAPAHVKAWWDELNGRYFAGHLPEIDVLWSTRLTASAGLFVSRVGPRHADASPRRRRITLSIPLLERLPRSEIMATLAHEMIHQWQYDVLKRRPNHGPDFQHKMQAMRRDGLDVTVRHSLDAAVEALSKYAWQCLRCGRVYRRQRRTIRPRRHRCGTCYGALRETTGFQVERRPASGPRVGSRPPRPTLEVRPVALRTTTTRPAQLELAFTSG